MTSEIKPSTATKRRRFTRRRVLAAGALLLSAIITVNIIAYMQARSMTHFVTGVDRTAPPEHLSFAGKLRVLFTGVKLPRPENTATPAAIGLPFETVRFGGAANDDLEAWYIPTPNSKGLCLQFHAYVACKSTLLAPARAFHEMGYDVLMVDFHGSGGSRGNETSIGYHEADDVATAVSLAQSKWPQKQILYAQSMGGAAVLRAVAQLNVHPEAVIVESCFDTLLSTTQMRFHAMHVPSFPLAQLLVFWGGQQEGFNGFKHNPADYAQNVRCPVLLINGGLDPRVSTEQAQNLFNHLAGPRRLEIFQNSGHCAFLNDDPSRWRNVVTGFLSADSASK